ncbi:MAG: glycosyltransferase [Puniceicoccales bacterium]|nr:glycosyltransferase [Puniceicoccales bacterium]
MRIVYLFTCFPVKTETFLQRELRAMRRCGDIEIEIWSLWRGDASWEGMKVNRYPFFAIFRVIFLKIALWTWRRPGAMRRVWSAYLAATPPGLLNIGENLLGLAFALDNASRFRAERPDLIHAVWGTMPAAAAWLLHELTGIPFSTGAHAYDVFLRDGDWTLPRKLACARLVHTSTQSARARLLELCPVPEKIHLIRRGIELPLRSTFDAATPFRFLPRRGDPGRPLRLLSVGRLVHKKGYPFQLAIYRHLRDVGEKIEARIVGDGPLLDSLRHLITLLGLGENVSLITHLEYARMRAQYEWADLFLFTGIVAHDGDRDGLPNVIPEAMCHGVPVLTTAVSGTTEAIKDGETGQVLGVADPVAWENAIARLRNEPAFLQRTRLAARLWTEREFDSAQNSARLARAFHHACRAR